MAFGHSQASFYSFPLFMLSYANQLTTVAMLSIFSARKQSKQNTKDMIYPKCIIYIWYLFSDDVLKIKLFYLSTHNQMCFPVTKNFSPHQSTALPESPKVD